MCGALALIGLNVSLYTVLYYTLYYTDFQNTSQMICVLITLFYDLVCYSLNGRV
jgi:hypothetical protein